jgi:hypothetical protein
MVVTHPVYVLPYEYARLSAVEMIRLAAVGTAVWILVAVLGAGSAVAAPGSPVVAAQSGAAAAAAAAGRMGALCYERP